ncbi:MAG: ABC transporter permease [Magnetococcales bacterium]|nr:ABC transporter permease [Magnetococcales bacterium]
MSAASDTSPLEEKVYSFRSRIRHPGEFLLAMSRDVWRSRELAGQLLQREIRQRYRQSVLGFFWIVIPPIVTTLIFVMLQKNNIINIQATEIPYPLYVMLGTVLWQVFTESVLAPLKAFDSCVGIMIKINMPREAPILAGMAQVLFFMGVQLLLAVGCLLWFGVTFAPGMVLAPLAVLALVIMGTGIGLFLVPLGGLFKDVAEGVGMLLRLLFFMTPIVYPPPTGWPWSLLVSLNPIVPVLTAARDLLAKGVVQEWAPFWFAAGGGVVLLLFGLLFYRITIPVVLERLGA